MLHGLSALGSFNEWVCLIFHTKGKERAVRLHHPFGEIRVVMRIDRCLRQPCIHCIEDVSWDLRMSIK